jgi:hypothetical protein
MKFFSGRQPRQDMKFSGRFGKLSRSLKRRENFKNLETVTVLYKHLKSN